jgi:gliding motility-associated-like protein
MISRLVFCISLCLLTFSSTSGNVIIKLGLEGPLTEADFNIIPYSCTQLGSITLKGLPPAGSSFSWKNSNGNQISSNSSITNLVPDVYTLAYTVSGSTTYELNLTVQDLRPHAQWQDITLACGENRIRVTAQFTNSNGGSVSYVWKKEDNTVESNQRSPFLVVGKYYLTVIDDKGCSSDPAEIIIRPASIRPLINENNGIISSSSCLSSDGSIRGLQVSATGGGPYTYRWTNGAGEIVGTQLNLIGIPAGKYRLSARLTDGTCEALSSEMIVEQRNPIISSTSSFISKSADCNMPNGAITGIKTNATAYKWIDVNGTIVATTLDMVNVREGYYELIVSNNFGCQEILGPFHVKAGDPMINIQSQPVVNNDSCNLGIGSIIGARVVGSGIRYRWTDLNNKELSTDPDLRNVRAGSYLQIISNSSCTYVFEIAVQNIESQLAAPVLEDKFVCSPTDILITFKEVAPLYRIYDENNNLLKKSKDRSFMLNVKENTTYYGSLGRGSCESLRTSFKVTVGESAINIPTSFSPNNDGINDTWVLRGIEVYNTADVKVFNRYGALVYQSIDPSNVFDGKKNGSDLPSGVYYYIIKLTNDCNPFTGSLTLLR